MSSGRCSRPLSWKHSTSQMGSFADPSDRSCLLVHVRFGPKADLRLLTRAMSAWMSLTCQTPACQRLPAVRCFLNTNSVAMWYPSEDHPNRHDHHEDQCNYPFHFCLPL